MYHLFYETTFVTFLTQDPLFFCLSFEVSGQVFYSIPGDPFFCPPTLFLVALFLAVSFQFKPY